MFYSIWCIQTCNPSPPPPPPPPSAPSSGSTSSVWGWPPSPRGSGTVRDVHRRGRAGTLSRSHLCTYSLWSLSSKLWCSSFVYIKSCASGFNTTGIVSTPAFIDVVSRACVIYMRWPIMHARETSLDVTGIISLPSSVRRLSRPPKRLYRMMMSASEVWAAATNYIAWGRHAACQPKYSY